MNAQAPVRDKIKVRKPAPVKCSASVLGRPGGTISLAELRMVNNVQVYGNCDYTVVSFVVSATIAGSLREVKSENDTFSIIGRMLICGVKPGGKFFIDKIVMKSNVTGQVFSVPNLKFTVTN